LENSKYFWRIDEPNAKCASQRPLESPEEEDIPKSISVEDFRRREIQMERELNRKVKLTQEKEKDGQVKNQLENMTPRVNYAQPSRILYAGVKIQLTQRRRPESAESIDQLKREQQTQRVIYQRESEIPKSPLEAHSPKSYTSLKDIMLIPFFKAGSFPPKSIKIAEQPIMITEDFLKILHPMIQPPPPPAAPPLFPMGDFPGMMPQMPSRMFPPMMPQSSRLGPLPSAPIPQFGGMVPNMPVYDPGLMPGAIDPYSMMKPGRVLYNPITKKPQNYRTVPCRRFHSQDGCERGDTCHFIHDFQHQGRPVPSFDWRNNSGRRGNTHGTGSNVPTYYPPPGSESQGR
jgi:hypothetical protein